MPPDVSSLQDRFPAVAPQQLVAELVPPPRFDAVRFATYLPDPGEPTQAAAVAGLPAFSARTAAPAPGPGGP